MQAAASDTKTNNRRDSDDMKTIIAASSNAHKIKEIQAIMDKFGMKVVSKKLFFSTSFRDRRRRREFSRKFL